MSADHTIPDEIRVALASDYVRQNFESGEPWSMTIARAVLDERERCAKVAEYAAQSCLSVETDGSGYYACEGVARDIRNPVNPAPQPVRADYDDLPF